MRRIEFVRPSVPEPERSAQPVNGAAGAGLTRPPAPPHAAAAGHGAAGSAPMPPHPPPPPPPLPHCGPSIVLVPASLPRSLPAARRTSRVDYQVVRTLRRMVSEQLTDWLRTRGEVPEDEQRPERDRLAREVVASHADHQRRAGTPVSPVEEAALLSAVAADLVGLGRLQTLLGDSGIEEVHILGHDRVRITRRDGSIEWAEPVAESDDELVELLQTVARRAGATERSMSTTKPTLDLQLPDGSRLAAAYLVTARPYAVIRRHNTLDVTLDDLAGDGQSRDIAPMIDPLMRDFLRAAMRAGLNMMIAGLAGAGKTTLLRALAAEIPQQEPFVVLEESRELGLHRSVCHPGAMSFEAREGHGERDRGGRPAGEVTLADLIPLSLRLGALRVIVGEVRSREIVPMLQAMTTSRGSMCTIHARSPAAVTDRIIELALSHSRDMTADLARRMAGNALDLIVYVTIEDETAIGGRKHRFVANIEEIDGVGDTRVATTTVFGPGTDGRGTPMHLPQRTFEQLRRAGYDARHLTQWIEAGHGAWRTPRDSLLGPRP